ncbi:MAG: ATP-binding protein [Acidobacteria bacterium]|nr:ATP-binding protein [Acidobacteriota bacterium]
MNFSPSTEPPFGAFSQSLDRGLDWLIERRPLAQLMTLLLVLMNAVIDWVVVQNSGLGFLYIFPMIAAAVALSRVEVVLLGVGCSILREAFAPFAGDPGMEMRLFLVTVGLTFPALFVGEIIRNRRLMLVHLAERERQDRTLRQVEQQMRAIMDTTPLAILTVSADGAITMANSAAARVFAAESGGLLGLDIVELVPVLKRLVREHSTPGLRTMLEAQGMRRDGRAFVAQIWCSVYQRDGTSQLAAVIWDATDTMRSREEASLELLGSLTRVAIGAVAHEVRNLAAAATMAHANLGRSAVVAAEAEFHVLGTLIAGVEKLASSNLAFSRRRTHEVTEPGALLDDLRVLLGPMCAESGIDLVWDLPPALPALAGNREQLMQVFLNLTFNAVRVLEESPGLRQLRISAERLPEAVTVRVQDSGPGIPDPSRLFHPLKNDGDPGGLGLFISRAILRAAGGDLEVEAVERGACFKVLLPIAAAGGPVTVAAPSPPADREGTPHA